MTTVLENEKIICTICGCEIEADEPLYTDEDGNYMDEECFIQHQAKNMGLIK